LVKVNQPDPRHARARERGARVRADAAAADDDDKGGAQQAQAVVAEEDAVARELLEDQLVVEVAVLCAVGERLVVLVFGVGFREGAGACYL
jgi:hypothetical protein